MRRRQLLAPAETSRSQEKRRRSPRYPAAPLSDAINAAHLLRTKDKGGKLSGAALARAIGYNSYSGIARTMIGAMRQFGLLKKRDGGLCLSSLAVSILTNKEGSDAYRAAIREAALTPALFRDLHALYRGQSEEAIRSYLISRRRFTRRGAVLAAAAYTRSLSLAEPVDSAAQPAVIQAASVPAAEPVPAEPMQTLDESLLTQTLLVSIPRNVRVDVSVHGDRIDENDLNKIKNQLDRWIEGLKEALD